MWSEQVPSSKAFMDAGIRACWLNFVHIQFLLASISKAYGPIPEIIDVSTWPSQRNGKKHMKYGIGCVRFGDVQPTHPPHLSEIPVPPWVVMGRHRCL